jgi:hypothetical protein
MGRQTGGIFRTTISVPTDLKERMDAVAGQVNWSAVAVRAFEERLAELAAVKKEKTMGDAIQRLRASKLRADDEGYKNGEQAGRQWAEHSAEADELQRLEKLLDGPAACHEWDWVSSDAYGIANYVLGAIRNEKDGAGDPGVDRQESMEFWQEVLDEEYPQGELLHGFVDGAVAFWREVQDKL